MINLLTAMATCVIIYAADRPSTPEIRTHEIAHCNGWVHEERTDYAKPGYQANKPPKKYRHEYKGPLEEYPTTSSLARGACGGHLGCQWFK